MRAAVQRRYGPVDVVTVEEVARPPVGPGDVLVRVAAAGVTTADWRVRAAAFPPLFWVLGRAMYGFLRPKQPVRGTDFAGIVAEVGAGVTRFAVGDRVFGFAPGEGAHADYLRVAEGAPIVAAPANLADAEAAGVPFGAMTAFVFLRDIVKVRPGMRLLVAGASGAVGHWVVQIAAARGAEVVALAGPAHGEAMRALGATEVVDYTAEDITRRHGAFDVIFDTAGVLRPSEARRMLRPEGLFVPLEFGLPEVWAALTWPLRGKARLALHVSGDRAEDLAEIAAMLEAGTIRPRVGARFPLHRIAEAYERVESRHAGGAVVLDIEGPKAVDVAV